MQFVGEDIYIQRGESLSIDFDMTDPKGVPFMILKTWNNPYIVITVTAARYEQFGNIKKVYWLDLKRRYVERKDGGFDEVPIKTFISTEALFLPVRSIDEALAFYGKDVGGKIELDASSDFDITNFLFVRDPNGDGNRVYEYVKEYTINNNTGRIDKEVWDTYNFRLIKQFDTKDWTEQGYLYDIKILAGESLQEYIGRQLDVIGESYDLVEKIWSDEYTQDAINRITNLAAREEAQKVFDAGTPLMTSYDTKIILLDTHNIFVSADKSGDVR